MNPPDRWVAFTEIFRKFAPHLMSQELKWKLKEGQRIHPYTVTMRSQVGRMFEVGKLHVMAGRLHFEVFKTPEHYFRIYEGFGMNCAAVEQLHLLSEFYRTTIITLHFQGKRFTATPQQWRSGVRYMNPVPPRDEQYVLSLGQLHQHHQDYEARLGYERQQRIEQSKGITRSTQTTLLP